MENKITKTCADCLHMKGKWPDGFSCRKNHILSKSKTVKQRPRVFDATKEQWAWKRAINCLDFEEA
jgi:hypothetical protein